MLTQQEAGGGPFEETFSVIGTGNGSLDTFIAGNIIWKPDPSGVPFPAGTFVKSVMRGAQDKECTQETALIPGSGTDIVNAIQVINLDATFTAPFKLQEDVAQ